MDRIRYKSAEIKCLIEENGQLTLTLRVDRDFGEWSDSELVVTIPANEVSSQYKVGNLLKFEEGKPEVLLTIPTDNMDYTEFQALEKRMEKMTCEQLITTHQSLVGKVNTSGIHDNLNYYDYFMSIALDKDFGYSIPKDTESGVVEFLNSQYVSTYYKEWIAKKIADKKLLQENTPQADIVYGAIKSERTIAEFNENEFDAIYRALQENYDYSNYAILALAFKLNSQGAIGFLNNQVDPITVAKRIVSTSGLSNRPEYYSGRGAKLGDMNGKHLISIFQKLSRLDVGKALNMVKMTMEMPTLGATEFIESLYRLAYSGYNLNNTDVSTNNFSFGNAKGKEMGVIGAAMFAEAFGGYRSDDTSAIKREFVGLLPKELSTSYSGTIDSSYYDKSGVKRRTKQ